jgi:type VI secretion system protein ImpJ
LPNRWPVHWADGTPLLPELFLAADRYTSRQVHEAEEWARPFAWGLRRLTLQIDHDEASLLECEARFKDGTKAVVPEDAGRGELRCDLSRVLQAPGATATLYLATPAEAASRHEVRLQEFGDDRGGPTVDIEVRRPRLELLAVPGETEPPGFVALPLARVGRGSRPGAGAEVLADYVPPLLTLDAWPRLLERLRQLGGLVHARARRLAGQLANRPLAMDSRLPDDALRMLKLQSFNPVDAYLGAVTALPDQTPWDVYLGLAQAAGTVALFAPDRHVPQVPAYRHEAIGEVFRQIIALIEAALGEEEAPPYDIHPFHATADERLDAEFQPSWRRERRRVLLGVATDLAPAACRQLLLSLDIATSSPQKVQDLFFRKNRGLEFQFPSVPPAGMPTSAGVVFFEFVENDRILRDIETAGALSIKVNPDLVSFRDDGIVVSSPSPSELRFALYVFASSR